MLNGNFVNSSETNAMDSLLGAAAALVSTSFSDSLKTKYGFKADGGLYFQFNSVELKESNYGNVMRSHDMDDVPEIEITKYGNALKNGGTIYDRRFSQKTFSIEFAIYSDTLENLELEIRNLKSSFEKGGYLYKREKTVTLKVPVKLANLEVSRLRLAGTTVNVKMLTMDPFWAAANAVTNFNEGNSGSFSGSMTLSNTNVAGSVKHMVYARTVTGSVTSAVVTLAGFPITINATISSGDVLVFDGIGSQCTVNGNVVKFYGQFPELQIGTTYPLSVTFGGTGSVDEFDLYNIYQNKHL